MPASSATSIGDQRHRLLRSGPVVQGDLDHRLDTEGVIGSVVEAKEDHHGLKIRARFSSVEKAQTIRTKMVEGHLRGMSFTYALLKHHFGEKDGRRVRFLDEVRLFEATVTPFPMNALALASAKRDPADAADDDRKLCELEQWAAATSAAEAVRHDIEHPAAAMYALGVVQEVRSRQQLAKLEAWAMSQPPPQPKDPTARRRAQWERNNAYSNDLAWTMATMPTCGHRSCMPGRCAYAR